MSSFSVTHLTFCNIDPSHCYSTAKTACSASFSKAISTISYTAANWHPHVIHVLDRCEDRLERFMPNYGWQNSFDRTFLNPSDEDGIISDLKQMNAWIDSNGDGQWYEQICIFIAKLPIRVARNIIGLLSTLITTLIKWSSYVIVHPLKAPIELAKAFFNLVHALTQPETWAKIGAGTMGASLGHTLATGNPLAAITLAISAAMVVGGVTLGTLKAALTENMDVAKKHFLGQVQVLPELMLTGLCTGLLIGGIQKMIRYVRNLDAVNEKLSLLKKEQAADFVREHGYVEDYTIAHKSTSHVTLKWNLNKYPDLRFNPDFQLSTDVNYRAVPTGNNGGFIIVVDKVTPIALRSFPLKGWVPPPLPPLPADAVWGNSAPVFGTGYTVTRKDI